jgi:hypothetical protein
MKCGHKDLEPLPENPLGVKRYDNPLTSTVSYLIFQANGTAQAFSFIFSRVDLGSPNFHHVEIDKHWDSTASPLNYWDAVLVFVMLGFVGAVERNA